MALLNLAGKVPPHSPKVADVIRDETLMANAKIAEQDSLIHARPDPIVDELPQLNKRPGLSKLIDDNFPFDESQLAAIHGMKSQRFACLTGAAGTGKTTCLKKLTDSLQHDLAMVDMNTYFKKPGNGKGDDYVDGDDYEVTERFVPSICLCSFTGRASQMIKKNFPRDWHGNIMTIHRMLAYMPEWYEAIDEETGDLKNKMRFIPTYNSTFKMPWDIIIIDEAGMLGIDLYNEVLAAMKPDARLYMVGDINQLPPTHGKSVFGFAMGKWPSWELTHIHRQVGVNNAIVDNAWKILKGQTPVSDSTKDPNWKFVMMEVPGDSNTASRYVRKWLDAIRTSGVYDPIRDSVITPINAYEQCGGYALGQDPLNRELALMFNKSDDRYIIDAGRDRKYFAVGDKVMATRNDYEAGITNGMTGIIVNIARNGAYNGDTRRFDIIAKVNEYLADQGGDYDDEFSLEDLAGAMETDAQAKGRKEEKESRDRGPASHIVTVRFGTDEHAFEIAFATLAEAASLMMAYVVTCHKMQGGEAPFIVVLCHQAHKRMLFREWLYTAVTRASQRVVILYTKQGLATALNKQSIKGSTLAQKVLAFQKLTAEGIVGSAVKVKIPDPETIGGGAIVPVSTVLTQGAQRLAQELDAYEAPVEQLTEEPVKAPAPETRHKIIIEHVTRVIHERPEEPAPEMDGGDLTPKKDWDKIREDGLAKIDAQMAAVKRLPAPKPMPSMFGAVRVIHAIEDMQNLKLLPAPAPKPAVPVMKFKLAGKGLK